MQAIIEAKELQQAVKQAGKVAGGKSSRMPILQTVRIDALPGELQLSATNLQTWGYSSPDCLTYKDEGPDSVIVSASILAKITGKLPAGEVVLSTEAGTLTIGGAVIPTLTIEDYPDTPGAAPSFTLGVFAGDVFKGLTKRLKAASSKTGNRPELAGVNVIYSEGRVKFASTDGFRLLLEEFATDCNEEGAVLVNAAELARIATLVKSSESVRLEIIHGDYERLVVSFASACYQLRGIPEEFPDFERVIPKACAVEFTVNRKALLSAVRRGLIVAFRDSLAVTLATVGGSSVLQMSSGCRDLGSYSENVRLDDSPSADGEPVSFNGSLLEDVLKFGKSETVRVSLGGRLQAGTISSSPDTVPGRVLQSWVVMPVNV